MKILSKKKLKRKGGIFGKSKTYGRKKIDRQAKKANKKVCINHPEAIFGYCISFSQLLAKGQLESSFPPSNGCSTEKRGDDEHAISLT